MREMKVRVWDDVLKEMLYSRVEQFDDMLGFRFEKHLETVNPIYMWSTGLKDKNKKEIYEGDIVKANLRFFDIVDQKCRVIFHNGSFGLQYGYSLDYFKPLATWDDIEVIGNIYENPELLKGDEFK